ncbi:hypothetical protein GcM1_231040 [Golovinomyces cichoracearum]|uniref:Uncharacterized protein n=1 Tax=Golovinomyces cichoracearum TaxID=62708 RepID=A0A420IML8_9PEZI|nr:hypothetical protein GcM1_231040 [Golovinomyces cichoracearum]
MFLELSPPNDVRYSYFDFIFGMLNRKVKDGVYKQRDGRRFLDYQLNEFAKEMTRIRRRLRGQHMIEIPDEPIMFLMTENSSPSGEFTNGGYRTEMRHEEASLDEILKSSKLANSTVQKQDLTSSTTVSSNQHWLIESDTEERLEKGSDFKICVDEVPPSTVPELWNACNNPLRSRPSLSNVKGRLSFVSSLFL